jgi:hypothetical protein
MEEQVSEEQIERQRRWHFVALVYGYNELAFKAETLGEKAYFRMGRTTAEDELKALGVRLLGHDPVVLQMPESGPPYIQFYEKDIELMREVVRKFDETKKQGDESQEKVDF